jgi:MFS family permease
MKRNLYSLYIIKISKWFNLVMPTMVLFYQDTGMGMQQILFLKAIYSLTIVIFEIPSGYCADVWGRQKTLLAGSILGALGYAIYSANTLYLGFVMAEIILGLGHSFISGADAAMLYDTLKSEDKAAAYLKHEGRITAGGNFAEALAGVAGGLLATISLRSPFYAQAVVAAWAIPAAMLLKEYINRHCASNVRATIFSLRNFMIRINFAVMGPFLGWVADRFGLKFAFWAAGLTYLVTGGLSIWIPLFRKKRSGPSLEKACAGSARHGRPRFTAPALMGTPVKEKHDRHRFGRRHGSIMEPHQDDADPKEA